MPFFSYAPHVYISFFICNTIIFGDKEVRGFEILKKLKGSLVLMCQKHFPDLQLWFLILKIKGSLELSGANKKNTFRGTKIFMLIILARSDVAEDYL
jgi:hypothetical protein